MAKPRQRSEIQEITDLLEKARKFHSTLLELHPDLRRIQPLARREAIKAARASVADTIAQLELLVSEDAARTTNLDPCGK